MAFRQMSGAPAIDIFFAPGTPQAWQWTLLAPWIESCPKENPRVEWSNFPKLSVDNNPSLSYEGSKAAVSTNITQLVSPGETIYFSWEDPGKKVGPDLSYTTANSGKKPTHALWLQQLNATYTPITLTGSNSGYAKLPTARVYDTEITSEHIMFKRIFSDIRYMLIASFHSRSSHHERHWIRCSCRQR